MKQLRVWVVHAVAVACGVPIKVREDYIMGAGGASTGECSSEATQPHPTSL